jgi:hypothetical protein
MIATFTRDIRVKSNRQHSRHLLLEKKLKAWGS